MEFSNYFWINEPKTYQLEHDSLTLQTEPGTDFWQRTFYGFQNDNAPAFVMPTKEREFSFTINVRYAPQQLFDQAGIIVYQDSENWFKASIEFETGENSKLGSVVTNHGFSDWATTDVQSGSEINVSYRLSRRNEDFLIESALDGNIFRQMRIFHLFEATGLVQIGVYACSPLQSSFQARFSSFNFGKCVWEPYQK